MRTVDLTGLPLHVFWYVGVGSANMPHNHKLRSDPTYNDALCACGKKVSQPQPSRQGCAGSVLTSH